VTERLSQSARRFRRFGVAAAIAVAGILPIAIAAGPAAATQSHWNNGCISWWYIRGNCSLSLSTSITSPGSSLTVYGTGYHSDSTVYLSLDPDGQGGYGHHSHFHHNFGLTSATTNSHGEFSQLVTIPGDAPYGGAKIDGDGTNPAGGSLDLSAHLLIVHAVSGPVATTTTVWESRAWAPYGREDKVTFGVDVAPAYGAAPSGEAVTIHIGSTTCVATLADGKGWCTIAATVLPIASGYAVAAAFLGATGFAPSASTNPVEFAVTREFQHITFGWLYGKTLSQSPVTVSATASSGLAVSFTTSTPTVCTPGGTNGAMITLLAPGQCTVVASQDGSATYAPATPVAEFFTVLPNPQPRHHHHHHH